MKGKTRKELEELNGKCVQKRESVKIACSPYEISSQENSECTKLRHEQLCKAVISKFETEYPLRREPNSIVVAKDEVACRQNVTIQEVGEKAKRSLHYRWFCWCRCFRRQGIHESPISGQASLIGKRQAIPQQSKNTGCATHVKIC